MISEHRGADPDSSEPRCRRGQSYGSVAVGPVAGVLQAMVDEVLDAATNNGQCSAVRTIYDLAVFSIIIRAVLYRGPATIKEKKS